MIIVEGDMVRCASFHPHDTTWYAVIICTRSGGSILVTVRNGFYRNRCLRYGKEKVKLNRSHTIMCMYHAHAIALILNDYQIIRDTDAARWELELLGINISNYLVRAIGLQIPINKF